MWFVVLPVEVEPVVAVSPVAVLDSDNAVDSAVEEEQKNVGSVKAFAEQQPQQWGTQLGFVDSVNRASWRSGVPLFETSVPPVPISEVRVDCWDMHGVGASIPSWADELFSHIVPVYDAIRNATRDEWMVLLGWVPSRFMGPQTPGRKASGDLMIAPTRGRNASVYLKEYNATWHVVVEQNEAKYYFQLLHRNAIRVCIRERLHLFVLQCSASPQQSPIPLYFCPPRHSHDAIARKTAKALKSGHRSERRAIMMTSTTPAPFSGSCVEAASAPWLVPRQDHPQFEYEGMRNDLHGLLRMQAGVGNTVIVVIFNKFWIDHLHNFVFSMVRRARMQNYIVATMDDEAYALCQENRLPCFDATRFSVFESDMVQGGKGFRMGQRRKVTEEMSWIKPRLAVAVLRLGFGFFMIDLDISWNRNPMPLIQHRQEDIVHQCDSSNVNSVNSGFYLAWPNPRTIQFFKNLMVFRADENSDQTAMKLFMRYDHTHGATHRCLEKWAFNMKCNYKVKGSVSVRHGVETFRWRQFDRRREKFFWVILHATCLSGAAAKMLYLRTMNAWFLDDLDSMTVGTSYCLLLPNSTVVQHSLVQNITTRHSEHYSRGIDEVFLKDRH